MITTFSFLVFTAAPDTLEEFLKMTKNRFVCSQLFFLTFWISVLGFKDVFNLVCMLVLCGIAENTLVLSIFVFLLSFSCRCRCCRVVFYFYLIIKLGYTDNNQLSNIAIQFVHLLSLMSWYIFLQERWGHFTGFK